MASTGAVKLDLENSSQQVLPDRRRRWEDLALVILLGFLPLVISGIYLLFVPVEAPQPWRIMAIQPALSGNSVSFSYLRYFSDARDGD